MPSLKLRRLLFNIKMTLACSGYANMINYFTRILIRFRDMNISLFYFYNAPITNEKLVFVTCPVKSIDIQERLSWEKPVYIFF